MYIHDLTDLGASSSDERALNKYLLAREVHRFIYRIASHCIASPIEAGNLTTEFKTPVILQLSPKCQLPPSPTCSLSGVEAAVGAEAEAGDKDLEAAAAAAPNLVARLMIRRSRAPTLMRPCQG